jgi:hypothetical protein
MLPSISFPEVFPLGLQEERPLAAKFPGFACGEMSPRVSSGPLSVCSGSMASRYACFVIMMIEAMTHTLRTFLTAVLSINIFNIAVLVKLKVSPTFSPSLSLKMAANQPSLLIMIKVCLSSSNKGTYASIELCTMFIFGLSAFILLAFSVLFSSLLFCRCFF